MSSEWLMINKKETQKWNIEKEEGWKTVIFRNVIVNFEEIKMFYFESTF